MLSTNGIVTNQYPHFLDTTPKSPAAKEKKNKLDTFRVKRFCALENEKMKRKYTKWEKIHVNHIIDKGFM